MKSAIAFLFFAAEGCVALGFAVYRFARRRPVPGALLTLIGVSTIAMATAIWRATLQLDPPLAALDSTGRIAMQASAGDVFWSLFVGFFAFIAAISFTLNPEVWGIRWLGYPTALFWLALGGGALVLSLGQTMVRYSADAQCFIEYSGVPDEPDGIKVAWSEVGAVKRIELWTKGTSGVRTSHPSQFIERRLVFFDREGKELLWVRDDLDPPERYKLFLESIPRWTGLKITEERNYR